MPSLVWQCVSVLLVGLGFAVTGLCTPHLGRAAWWQWGALFVGAVLVVLAVGVLALEYGRAWIDHESE